MKKKLVIGKLIARKIAEDLWEKGGTCLYETNRNGAYWFSCSSHGGYIVDENCLSLEERNRINEIGIFSEDYNFVKNGEGIIGTFKAWVFEEDCAWSVLETLTDIRRIVDLENNKVDEARKEVFETYYRKQEITI